MRPSTTDGMPALGRHDTGMRAWWARWRRCSPISAGPVAQLMPMTSGRSASSAVRAAPISVPGSMRPVISIVTCTWSGTSRPTAAIARRAADEAGLGAEQVVLRLDEQQVDAALEQAARLRLVGVAQGVEADLAERGELRAGADRAGDEAGPVRRRPAVGDLAGEPRGARR